MVIFLKNKYKGLHFELKWKFTFAFVSIFSILIISFSSIIYFQFKEIQGQRFDEALLNYAVDVAESINIDSFGEFELGPSFQREADKILPFSLGTTRMAFLDIDGNLKAYSSNSQNSYHQISPDELDIILNHGHYYENLKIGKDRYRVISYYMPTVANDLPYILQVIVRTDQLNLIEARFLKKFYLMIPIMLLIVLIVGVIFSRKMLNPIEKIIDQTRKINASNLSLRVPVSENEDELQVLSLTINSLLDKIESAFIAQDRFIQDASHQLKTPLAILKGELEQIKLITPSEEELKNFLKSSEEEIRSLISLTNNLLILARIDSGKASLVFEEIDLEHLLLQQIERLAVLAQKKNIRLEIFFEENDVGYKINGESILLGVLFFNLIENAIKYSFPERNVNITLKKDGTKNKVIVVDRGVGIDPKDIDSVFDRFYRAGQNVKIEGHGLGLAICKKVVELHKGTIRYYSNELNETIFEVII